MYLSHRNSPLNRYLRHIEGEETGAGGQGGAPPAPTFDAAQNEAINRIVQQREAEAARKATQAEQKRIEDYLAAEKTAADLANADEATRLRAERDQALAAATTATETASLLTAQTTARLELADLGMGKDTLADGLSLLGPLTGDDQAAIAAKAAALKARLPLLFTPATPPPGAPGAHTKPAATRQQSGATKSMADLGREGAARRGWAPNTAA